MTWIRDWKTYLKKLKEESDGEIQFGHNCWEDTDDAIRQFSQLEKLGGKVYVDTVNHPAAPYCIKVVLDSNTPYNKVWQVICKGDIAMHILLKMPPASRVELKKSRAKKNFGQQYLELEWHW